MMLEREKDHCSDVLESVQSEERLALDRNKERAHLCSNEKLVYGCRF